MRGWWCWINVYDYVLALFLHLFFDLPAQRTRARESSGVDMEYPLRNRIMFWEAMCKGP